MQDLDRLRGTCRVWNEESCSILQEKKVVALLEIDSMKYYLEKFSSTLNFPHLNFELHMENLLDPNVMRRFWNLYGPRIKSLDLRQSSLLIETLFDIIAQHLPTLERLAIKSLPRKMSVRRNSHPPPLPLMLANQHQQQNFAMPLNPPPLNVMIVNQLQHHHLELQQQQQPVARLDWSSLRFPQIKELTLCWCPQDEDSTIIILKDLLRSLPCLERLLVTDIPPLAVGGIGIGGQQPANVGVGTRASK